MQLKIREIEEQDNPFIAKILRDSLLEHHAAKPGTAYFDQSTDSLYQFFQKEKACYFVAEIAGEIVGGVGIYPTEGLPANMCELVKMYIDSTYRGLGIGKKLIEHATAFAKSNNYTQIYLESMPELEKAVSIYAHLGFELLDHPLGNTGHFSCPIWMLKAI
jgi:putative acetyltransferase